MWKPAVVFARPQQQRMVNMSKDQVSTNASEGKNQKTAESAPMETKSQISSPKSERACKRLFGTTLDYRVKPQWEENPKPTNLKKKENTLQLRPVTGIRVIWGHNMPNNVRERATKYECMNEASIALIKESHTIKRLSIWQRRFGNLQWPHLKYSWAKTKSPTWQARLSVPHQATMSPKNSIPWEIVNMIGDIMLRNTEVLLNKCVHPLKCVQSDQSPSHLTVVF